MMKRILLPLERGDDGADAVSFARALARRRRVEILLLRVEEWPVFGSFGFGWTAAWRAGDLEPLKAALEREEGVRVRILWRDSCPAAAVPRHALELGASLILVPYSCDRSWSRLLSGHPAERLLRESPVPILAVPSVGGPGRAPARILYAHAGDEAALSGLRHVIDFAQMFEAAVDLLRLGGGSPSIDERLLAVLGRREVPARVLAPSADLASAAAREDVGLVILSGRRDYEKAGATLARRVLQAAPVPLLLTREGPTPGPFVDAAPPLRIGI